MNPCRCEKKALRTEARSRWLPNRGSTAKSRFARREDESAGERPNPAAAAAAEIFPPASSNSLDPDPLRWPSRSHSAAGNAVMRLATNSAAASCSHHSRGPNRSSISACTSSTGHSGSDCRARCSTAAASSAGSDGLCLPACEDRLGGFSILRRTEKLRGRANAAGSFLERYAAEAKWYLGMAAGEALSSSRQPDRTASRSSNLPAAWARAAACTIPSSSSTSKRGAFERLSHGNGGFSCR
mmetsp:Transcript_40996/g.97408  ORF Transcript_40996/g.97408 Transcript_40996/m.97408 type:complete len:241 (+) Transcript_40996:1081-1803(+)